MLISKKDMACLIAEKYEDVSPKDATAMVDKVLDVITESVANGDEVRLFGFGTFLSKVRPARKAHNPQTGEMMTVAEKKVVAFKAAKAFTNKLNAKEE